jgi:hypothetical protein
MEVIGKIIDLVPTLKRTVRITIETDSIDAAEGLEALASDPAPLLKIRLAKARKARSLDANAYFWACVGIIAEATQQAKDETYHGLLKRYGVYTYLVVKEDAVDRLRSIWRDIEILGDTTTETGAKGKSVLAFFGSSTYNSKEMSRLIDGTVSEIKEMGLTPPPTREINELITDWRTKHG